MSKEHISSRDVISYTYMQSFGGIGNMLTLIKLFLHARVRPYIEVLFPAFTRFTVHVKGIYGYKLKASDRQQRLSRQASIFKKTAILPMKPHVSEG